MNDTDTPATGTHTAELVDAPLSNRTGLGVAWVLPLAALALAVALGWSYWSERGARVEVRFATGHGLEAGAAVRYRGTAVGQVDEVLLDAERGDVLARLRLRPEAEPLAREGTRWWIARPRVDLRGVEGLDTVLGARYVTLEPGPRDAAAARRFQGLDEPPVRVPFEGGLELVLEAPTEGGLAPGAPVLFRQVDVGVVLSVGLASDASSVLVRVSIAPDYAGLVREGTVFWNASGVRFEAGILEGVELSIDSLEALLTGAVAFATPPDAGGQARAGARLRLEPRARPEWLEWSTRLPVGASGSGGAPLPERAALSWKRWRLLGTRARRSGWCLRLEDGWLGPADLLEAPVGTDPDAVDLEIGGERHEPLAAGSGEGNLRLVPATGGPGWPRERVRVALEPEHCLVHGDPALGVRAIDAGRLTSAPGGSWLLADGSAFDEDWHGAAVVARSDGRLVGLLLVDGDGVRVAVDLPAAR